MLPVDIKESEYKKKARESWDITWGMLCSTDWKVVAGENLETGLISCMHCGKFGKVFMVEVSRPKQFLFTDCQSSHLFTPRYRLTIPKVHYSKGLLFRRTAIRVRVRIAYVQNSRPSE